VETGTFMKKGAEGTCLMFCQIFQMDRGQLSVFLMAPEEHGPSESGIPAGSEDGLEM